MLHCVQHDNINTLANINTLVNINILANIKSVLSISKILHIGKMAPKNQNEQRNGFDIENFITFLETVQNIIVFILAIGLFGVMVIRLYDLFTSLIIPIKFQNITSDILFILILVELFKLLIIYLREQRISVGVAVEVTIVSVLREIIIRGALEIPWQQILSVCSLLLVLGILLLIRAWMSHLYNNQDLMEDKIIYDDN